MKTISTLIIALGAVGLARAETILYTPAKSIVDQLITVHPWGGGTIAETDENAYEGTTSIRVSTRSLFSGGQVFFGSPVDLSKEYSDKNDLLQITFKVADDSTTMGGGGKGPAGPSAAGAASGAGKGKGGPGSPFGGGLPPGGGFGGQRGGGGTPPPRGGFGGPQGGIGGPPGGKGGFFGGLSGGGGAASQTSALKTMRLVITTTDGLKSEAYVPTDVSAGSNGWRQLGLPLQAITGFARTNKTIKTIAFGGDATTSVWIGDLRTVVDSTPITGDTNVHDLNLAEGDEVTLTASGYAGSSMLKYDWYFDGDTTGLPDSSGQVIKHRFNKRGTYTFTVVIRDYFGLKQPYKATISIKVN